MNRLVFLLLFIIPFFGNSQNYADKEFYLVDSLVLEELSEVDKIMLDSSLAVFHNSENDTIKITTINYISEIMYHVDWVKYLFLTHQMILDLQKTNPDITEWSKGPLAEVYGNIGYYNYYQKGNVKKAIKFYEKGLELHTETNNKKGMGVLLSNIGFAYFEKGEFKNAHDHLEKALKIRRDINDEKGISYTLEHIAKLYLELGDTIRSLSSLFESKEIREKVNDKKGLASSYDLLSNIYMSQNNFKEALQYANKALNYQLELGDLRGATTTYGIIGDVFMKNNNLKQALKYYNEQNKMAIEKHYVHYQAMSYVKMAHVYLLQNTDESIQKAKELANMSHEMTKELKFDKDLIYTSKILYEVYKKTGDDHKALELFELYMRIKESQSVNDIQKALVKENIERDYLEREKKTKLENEKQLLVSKEREKRNVIIIGAVTIVLLITIAFLIYLFNRYKLIGAQKSLIQQQSGQIQDSINYAKQLQEIILPSKNEFLNHFEDLFILYKPKDVVSGDFYWAMKKDDIFYFSVIDCTGHGVRGAFMSLLSFNLIERIVGDGLAKSIQPNDILHKIDEELVKILTKDDVQINDGMDLMFCAYDTQTRVLSFSGARNALIHFRGNEIKEIQGDRLDLGAASKIVSKKKKEKEFTLHQIQCEKGDQIYLSTDGYIDQIGGVNNKKIYQQGMIDVLKMNSNQPFDSQKQQLVTHIQNWIKDGEMDQLDDVCVLGLKL